MQARLGLLDRDAHPAWRFCRIHPRQHHLIQRQAQLARDRAVHQQDPPLNRPIIAKAKHRSREDLAARHPAQHPRRDQRQRHRSGLHLLWPAPRQSAAQKDRDPQQPHQPPPRLLREAEIEADANAKAHRHPGEQLAPLGRKRVRQRRQAGHPCSLRSDCLDSRERLRPHGFRKVNAHVRGSTNAPRRDPVRPLTDRLSAHRRRAHRAVQLALRARSRRQVPAAHRRHRPRTLHPRGDRGDSARADLARARLGRRGGQPVRTTPPPRRCRARDAGARRGL
ncbi:hypothetical protein GALL_536520 [mine drainage metagenome]|uniref:Uncharacterized protein n=1 Tax=mine drainage metagenome TaxID=410659 RepID=A0A1J5PBD9_9ZZZZ